MGTKCNSILALLSKYSDRELDEPQTRVVVRHLESCALCAVQLAEYQSLNELLVAPEPIPESPYMWTRVRTAIRARPASGAGVWSVLAGRLRPVAIPFAAAAVVALAVLTGTQLSRTIVVGSRDAAARAVNIEPEEGNLPVTIPIPADTLEDSLDIP
jgi:anti-sigma factor RsiW